MGVTRDGVTTGLVTLGVTYMMMLMMLMMMTTGLGTKSEGFGS